MGMRGPIGGLYAFLYYLGLRDGKRNNEGSCLDVIGLMDRVSSSDPARRLCRVLPFDNLLRQNSHIVAGPGATTLVDRLAANAAQRTYSPVIPEVETHQRMSRCIHIQDPGILCRR